MREIGDDDNTILLDGNDGNHVIDDGDIGFHEMMRLKVNVMIMMRQESYKWN